MAQDFARLENHFAERHWHELEIGFNGAKLIGGQGRQQKILAGGVVK